MKVGNLFYFLTGYAEALEKIENGTVPLVYGTSGNNGIVKYVSVSKDLIFSPPLITVSYLGTAFVQTVAFTTSVVDKSNIIVLKPQKSMSLKELYFYCYQINRHGKFGYNYGRRMNMARLRKIDLVDYTKEYDDFIADVSTSTVKPHIDINNKVQLILNELVPLTNIFELHNAKSSAISLYERGNIPFVSNGFMNNGIVGYIQPQEGDKIFPSGSISISAFCEAIVQQQEYVARGNGGSGLTILIPKTKLDIKVLLEYAAYINQYCKWRFLYGRMVSIERLEKLRVPKSAKAKAKANS